MKGLKEKAVAAFSSSAAWPKTVLLVRGGETIASEGGLLCGWLDPRLNTLGRRQAHEVFRELRSLLPTVRGVFCSDLRRSFEFADIATGFRGQRVVKKDSRLREINFGADEGLCYDTLSPEEQTRIDDENYSAPGGETWGGVRVRMLDFFSKLEEGKYIAFAHGGAICALTRSQGLPNVVPNATCLFIGFESENHFEVTLLQSFSTAEMRRQITSEF